jgi:hypothetical protein
LSAAWYKPASLKPAIDRALSVATSQNAYWFDRDPATELIKTSEDRRALHLSKILGIPKKANLAGTGAPPQAFDFDLLLKGMVLYLSN